MTLADALVSVGGPHLGAVGTMMGRAEDVIEQYKKKFPLRDEVHWCFGVLNCPVCLYGLDLRLYDHHAGELIERVLAGQDTRPATDAELIAHLAAMAAKSPLRPAAVCLYTRLFKRVFPHVKLDEYDMSLYDRDADELDALMRSKLAWAERVFDRDKYPRDEILT
jgi:hypothetical protein